VLEYHPFIAEKTFIHLFSVQSVAETLNISKRNSFWSFLTEEAQNKQLTTAALLLTV